MNALEELRRRYPWPAERPDVPEDWTGWFHGENRELFQEHLDEDTKYVIELGSLCGLSTKCLVETAPNAVVICIDHWKGSAEHQGRVGNDWENRLPELYERFVRNMWPWRDRVVPVKTTTVAGMSEVHSLGIKPQLIYVDASHDIESVRCDVTTCLDLFPEAVVVGDDWARGDVRMGVVQATYKRCRWLGVRGWGAWYLPVEHRE